MSDFFVGWELWQKMTFVLAGCIVIVFFMGLGKLWWNNRLMKKKEVLDLEKRARLSEMRRAGLHVKKTIDIPFGVRAIQSGVQVEGIWISRSASPAANIAVPSATLVAVDTIDKKLADEKAVLMTTANADVPLPRGTSPTNRSIFQRLNDADSSADGNSPYTTTAPPSHFAAPRPKHPRVASALNEDTLRRLEVQGYGRPGYETYVPTTMSSSRQPRRPSQRSSASSSGDSTDSTAQRSTSNSNSGGGKRSHRSSRSSGLSYSRHLYEVRHPAEYHGAAGVHFPGERISGGDPFATPQSQTPISPVLPGEQQQQTQYSPGGGAHPLAMPEPTFGPGDLHMNRTPRRVVNPGFEVLPTGTFGVPPELGVQETYPDPNEEEEDQQATEQRRRRQQQRRSANIVSQAHQQQYHGSAQQFQH